MPTSAPIAHALQERMKELSVLHRTARLLQDDRRPLHDVFLELVAILPAAWQYPQNAAARIRFDSQEWLAGPLPNCPFTQAAAFQTSDCKQGSVEVLYPSGQPPADEGPFLREERELIDSIAEMIRLYCERKSAQAVQAQTSQELEAKVRERTAALEAEILERKKNEEQIRNYQTQLRQLASSLARSEQRQRRELAVRLHDGLGQALSLLKMRIATIQGNAVFCGLDREFSEIRRLLDQTIQYTRTLTFELAPPVLYELGLVPALESLAEKIQNTQNMLVKVTASAIAPLSPELRAMLFEAVRELLHNAIKHGQAHRVQIKVSTSTSGKLQILVIDDGIGFDDSASSAGFGLFSIRERLADLGGTLDLHSSPKLGTTVILSVEGT